MPSTLTTYCNHHLDYLLFYGKFPLSSKSIKQVIVLLSVWKNTTIVQPIFKWLNNCPSSVFFRVLVLRHPEVRSISLHNEGRLGWLRWVTWWFGGANRNWHFLPKKNMCMYPSYIYNVHKYFMYICIHIFTVNSTHRTRDLLVPTSTWNLSPPS